MKNLMTLVVAVMFTVVTFAQDTKTDMKTDTKQSTTTTKSTVKMGHECYKMKDNALLHCYGEKDVPQKTDVKLKNGTTITTSGTVITKDGTKTQLENGQCVSLMGSIGDCDKMHMKSGDEKMQDNMK